jgi:hypothetical protein
MSGEQQLQTDATTKVIIPITEAALDENTRKIPKVVFIDDTDAWVEKYTDDALFG